MNKKEFIEFVDNSVWQFRKCNVFVLHTLDNGLVYPSYNEDIQTIEDLQDTEENYRTLVKECLPNIKQISLC